MCHMILYCIKAEKRKSLKALKFFGDNCFSIGYNGFNEISSNMKSFEKHKHILNIFNIFTFYHFFLACGVILLSFQTKEGDEKYESSGFRGIKGKGR